MTNEIYLYGSVGASFWGEDAFTPSDVRDMLAELTGPLTVRINSGGGIASDGQAIHNILRAYPDTVDVVIDGAAASAASLIAMAGDSVTLRAGAYLMIHDPAQWTVDGRGTEDDHLRAAAGLRVLANGYAKVYAARAGISADAARAIMKAETWFEGQAAIDAGFADAMDEGEALPAAAFDYGVYMHAPQGLHPVAAPRPQQTTRQAALAMMMGVRAPDTKGTTMTDKTKATEDEDTVMASEGNDTVTATEDEDTVMAAEGEDTVAASAQTTAEEDDETDAKAEAVAILQVADALGQDLPTALAVISKGLTVAQATEVFHQNRQKGNPMNTIPTSGGATASIVRDERETMREGMEGALVAQMSRQREVKGPARDYMAMGIVDMAAASIGHTGPIRRGRGMLDILDRALMAHTTSDFPAIFENALNKRLMDTYTAAQPTYRKIAARMDFTDFRPHPVSNIGDFPTLKPVGQNGEIQYGSTDDKKEVVSIKSFGRAFRITRQMMIDDDLGGIERMLMTRGRAVAAFEDAYFYSMMLGGANGDGPTLLETTRQVFNTTDKTKAATAAAITVASLSAGRSAMMKKKGLGKDEEDQLDLEITPSILLVGPNKLTEAEQLIANITPDQARNVNPFSGRLEVVATNKITGNAWYLFADPTIAPVFVYGYLVGAEGPRMRMDEPFGQSGMAYSVELDFAAGGADFRGGYKNAGA